MLKLVLPKKELTSASIPVRWFLDEQALMDINKTGLTPYICFNVYYERGRKSARHLFPLDQLSAYLDVHYPGTIKIMAAVVTSDKNRKSDIAKCFVADTCNKQYLYSNTAYDADKLGLKAIVRTYDASNGLSIEVAEKLFGKELTAWSKFFVNRYWYRNKPIDECDQRRRLILFPFTTLPVLILDFLLREIRSVATTLLQWLFFYHFNLNNIIHPFSHDYDLDRDSSYIVKNIYDKFKIKKIGISTAVAISTPIMPVILIAEMFIIGEVHDKDIFTLFKVIAFNYSTLIIGFIFWWTAINIIVKPVSNFIELITDKIMRFISTKSSLISPVIDKIDALIDNTVHITVSRNLKTSPLLRGKDESLPVIKLRDKSFRLIFADIKNSVCKPMQG